MNDREDILLCAYVFDFPGAHIVRLTNKFVIVFIDSRLIHEDGMLDVAIEAGMSLT